MLKSVVVLLRARLASIGLKNSDSELVVAIIVVSILLVIIIIRIVIVIILTFLPSCFGLSIIGDYRVFKSIVA